MTPQKSLQLWTIVLLGLVHISIRCDARAVNVSNTWTMPQEGLNVFYRFFRDRISWFEADAVCQFHHANLVTVDNSFQFDATRDLLRELDVNDIVWIGLMRPQNSEHFMWSNSRPLVTDTGYWAESLPLMESPLCAVIDPIRDYRWHALRCGGPETASFLCEMPVPSWADACILKDMPNLTMQYMADTASIELIRNCEEEGLLRQTCKGKQDRDIAIRELICPRERLEAQRINDITNSHFKSLQIINSIRTDNNENNDIELLPLGLSYGGGGGGGSDGISGVNSEFVEETPTEKNTVQRLIEQFNVDELMQADEPAGVAVYRIPGEIPKPVKKTTKKVIVAGEYTKPKQSKYGEAAAESAFEQTKVKKQKLLALHDMMMGDQPMGEPEMPEPEPQHDSDDDVSNEIMEPLPHKKKILPQDLKTMATITEKQSHDGRHKQLAEQQHLKTKEKQQLPQPQQQHASPEESSEEVKEKHVPTHPNVVAITTAATTTTTEYVPTTSAPTSTTTSTTTTTARQPMTSTTTTTTTTTTAAPTTEHGDEELPAEASMPGIDANQQRTTTSGAPPTATLPPATIGHPMHPQQPRSNVITEETQHPHVKESADNSHFIPPMLLVKSHYVPPTKHAGDGSHHEHDESTAGGVGADAAATAITATAAGPTPVASSTTRADAETLGIAHSVTAHDATTEQGAAATHALTHEHPGDIVALTKTAIERAISHAAVVERNVTYKEAPHTPTTTTQATTTAARIAVSVTPMPDTHQQQQKRSEAPGDAAPGIDVITSTTTTVAPSPTATAQEELHVVTTMKTPVAGGGDKAEMWKMPAAQAATYAAGRAETVHDDDGSDDNDEHAAIALATDAPSTITVTATTAGAAPTTLQNSPTSIAESAAALVAIITSTAKATPVTVASVTTTAAAPTTVATATPPVTTTATAQPPTMAPITTTPTTTTTTSAFELTTEAPTPTHDFMKEDTDTPFKPNRRRSLTKPETASYFKKILG